jgi:hypothetical protein
MYPRKLEKAARQTRGLLPLSLVSLCPHSFSIVKSDPAKDRQDRRRVSAEFLDSLSWKVGEEGKMAS